MSYQRDALVRVVCAWISTLEEEDLRAVDRFVFDLIARREEADRSNPVEAGLAELCDATAESEAT